METLYFVSGNRKVPVRVEQISKSRLELNFAYDKGILANVKMMKGAKWHGFDKPNPKKTWTIEDCARNRFQMEFLQGLNPYRRYDEGHEAIAKRIMETKSRDLRHHQIEMSAAMLKYHYVIIAGEMGTGKTLAMIECLERSGLKSHEVIYVGPRAGVSAVGRELLKWKSSIYPGMITYESLTRDVDEIIKRGTVKAVIYDESSKVKNPTAKRSLAAEKLANYIQDTWMGTGYVILMTGTPAPKAPTDWFHQAAVACPGFLKEGDIHKFKRTLCIIEERQSIAGGVYPHVVTWRDDVTKCDKCGLLEGDDVHCTALVGADPKIHQFVPSTNEIARLYRRLRGLVQITFKKDCLDLPDKQYRILQCKPTVEVLRMAQMIKTTGKRAIEILSKLRELSDGFQYTDTKDGDVACTLCGGAGKIYAPVGIADTIGPIEFDGSPTPIEDRACDKCGGSGTISHFSRTGDRMPKCPKDDVLIDLLDEHEEVGRIVVWAGFTESIDKLVDLVRLQGWYSLRIDGRGYMGLDPHGNVQDSELMLTAMDNSHPRFTELREKYPQIAVIGNPKAGGMALTLHAAPTAIYYSNVFDGEARIQSEDRIHRMGMDENRGCQIIDIMHLPTDMLVLENLRKKKKMQDLSMGELETVFSDTSEVERV
jgi:hypothetical protein